jgi:hypothetical protein
MIISLLLSVMLRFAALTWFSTRSRTHHAALRHAKQPGPSPGKSTSILFP